MRIYDYVKNHIGTFKIYVLMWKKGISKLLPEVAANTSAKIGAVQNTALMK